MRRIEENYLSLSLDLVDDALPTHAAVVYACVRLQLRENTQDASSP